MSNTILIAYNEIALVERLQSSLEDEGWQTIVAMDGAEALHITEEGLPDLVILDLAIPKVDGYEVLHQIREQWQNPVIVVSAQSRIDDKVRCLDLGADDYITKPFAIEEMVARVKAVLRRNRSSPLSFFTCGNLKIDFSARLVTANDNEVRLTPIEFKLLQQLVLHAGKVLTHSYLLAKVWGAEYRQSKEYLHVFISRLRANIESDPRHPRYIITIPGIGYRFKTD
jgi:two-component system KDP operon response regulator KdpE